MRNPKVGMNVKVKPEKAVEPGLLPVELAESLRFGKFEIVKCQADKSGRPGSALKMPEGVGEPFTVNGRQQWAWFVYDDDIAEEDEKGPKEVSAPAAIKAGDIVKTTYLAELGSQISEEENRKGFRVLGIDGQYLVIEVAENKGLLRESHGKSTLKMKISNAVLVKEFKFEKGAFVKAKLEYQSEMPGRLNNFDHNVHGFRILEIRGTKAILEMPAGRAAGVPDAKHPNKLTATVELSKLEGAVPLVYRRGDKIRVKADQLPYGLTEQQKRQKMEIIEVSGYMGSLEYTVKLPDGRTSRYNENKFLYPNKEATVSADFKFKKGMKVKVKETYRDAELPESMTDAAKAKAFEVLEADEYNDQVLLKMPNSIDEADESSEYSCHVWYVGRSYLESLKESKKMSNRNGVDRSEMSFSDRAAASLEKGAIKTVGKKLTNAVKAGLLRGLEASALAEGTDSAEIASGLKMFKTFMESQMGNALISGLIGLAIQQGGPLLAQYVEAFQDERVQDLADEMTSEGVSIVMDKVVDMVTEYILPDVADILKGLPPKKKEGKGKVRVTTETSRKTKKKTIKVGGHDVDAEVDADAAEEEEEEEEIRVPARHAKAA